MTRMPALVSLRSSDMAIAPLVRTEAALARTARRTLPRVVYTRRRAGRSARFALLAALLLSSSAWPPWVRQTEKRDAAGDVAGQQPGEPGSGAAPRSARQNARRRQARAMLVRILAFTGDMHGAEAEAAELAKHVPEGNPRAWIELGLAARGGARFRRGARGRPDTAAGAAPAAGPRGGCARLAGVRWKRLRPGSRRRSSTARGRGNPLRSGSCACTSAISRVLRRPTARGSSPTRRARSAGSGSRRSAMKGSAAALQAYDAILVLRPRFAPAELDARGALAKLGRKEDARAALERAEEMGAPAGSVAKQRAALAAP